VASIPSGSITSYYWNFGDNYSATYNNGNNFSRGYNAAQPYTVRMVAVSDNNCASDTATGIINVRPLPDARFNMPQYVCMPGGAAAFTSISTIGDNSSLNHNWNFGDGNTSTNANPSHNYGAINSYPVTLTVTSAYGCSATATQTFDAFYDKPQASFEVTPETLCQGTDNVFTDQSFAPNSSINSWNWNFGDGSPVNSARNPVKRYSSPGNYTITLTVKNTFGCTSDPTSRTVTVYLQPRIDAGPSFVVPQGTMVTFRPTVNGNNGVSFMWSPAGDFANPSSLQQSLVATRSQTYTLTATGAGNCTATDTMSVKILKPVSVPNSFSPNGDGINDQWVIPNLAEYPNMNVEVYNRYGQKVFQSVGYGRPWDGTYNGQPLPFGTYYYIINLRNGFAPLTGSVTIVK
jgi:gliding motility-associated-like protein